MKVVVLGFDGMGVELAERVPYMPRCLTKLDPVVPSTYPAWTSIMTGVPPAVHGIIDFVRYEEAGDGKPRAAGLESALSLRYPRVHEAIALAGARITSLVVNPIPPAPLIPVKRAHVMRVATLAQAASAPPGLLGRAVGRDLVREVEELLFEGGCGSALRGVVKLRELVLSVLDYAASVGYDLVWVTVPVPDALFHRCARYALERRAFDRLADLAASVAATLVLRARRYASNVIVASDHGFRLYRMYVNVNSVLRALGLARVGGGGLWGLGSDGGRAGRARGAARALELLRPVLPSKALSLVSSRVPEAVRRRLGSRAAYGPRVDEEGSEAFMPWRSLRGTELGAYYYIVTSGRPRVIEEVVEALRRLGVHAWSARRALTYFGSAGSVDPSLARVLDKLVAVAPGEAVAARPGRTTDPPYEAGPVLDHARYGLLAVEGDDVACVEVPGALPSFAVAQLVLALLGAPLGAEMPDAGLEHYFVLERPVGRVSYAGRWRLLLRLRAALAPAR